MPSLTPFAIQGFRRALEPLFEMLEHKEKSLTRGDWIELVNATKERVVKAPDQFLAGITKSNNELAEAVEAIFRDRLN
jgi:hypothetical protein